MGVCLCVHPHRWYVSITLTHTKSGEPPFTRASSGHASRITSHACRVGVRVCESRHARRLRRALPLPPPRRGRPGGGLPLDAHLHRTPPSRSPQRPTPTRRAAQAPRTSRSSVAKRGESQMPALSVDLRLRRATCGEAPASASVSASSPSGEAGWGSASA